MGAPQVHLMLNHLPVLGVLFSALVLGIGLLTRNTAISRLAIATLLAAALAGIPVFLSGEPAEEAIEHSAGVSERVIEVHENAARVAIIALEILGLAALAGLALYRRSDVSRGFASILLVATLALSGWMAWTAHLGGQIRHEELRGGTVASQQAPDAEAGEEQEDD
ncbi:MAG TPA: hypothetical protein VFQ05_04805 [Candidatus Eisenbacteria bacterium]|nr:hypothetical protein [Candidatus Eisenbacteria bacterium]